MAYAGIDVGAKNIKVVIVDNGKILAKALVPGGFEQEKALEQAFNTALKNARLKPTEIKKIVATGVGRTIVKNANDAVTEVTADVKGAFALIPSARTVIDVGAEEGRGIRIDENGKVVDFAVNEKCAAGAGAFVEAMARALEVSVESMGELSLKSSSAVPMNAQCAVFAESEVVSLIHAKTPKPDIARAIHDAIASRIASMVRRVGLNDDVVLIGGVAYNKGFVDSLSRSLEKSIKIPEAPEFVSALGAALLAAEK
ncbi:MAG: acyl-CoA dehydratase activase [Planctomycetota bacterium]|nr:acyl-CoA dehydratase activase [Planctomycetota bacterium]